MQKHTLFFITLLSSIVILLRCGGDKSTGPAGVFQETNNIIEHDTTNHTITIERVEYRCEDDSVIADSSNITYHYALQGNELYIWKPGECGAGLFHGSSGSVYGTCVASHLDPVQIPGDVRPLGCGSSVRSTIFGSYVPDGGLADVPDDSILINESVTATITPSSVNIIYDADFCLAMITADLYSLLLVQTLERTCESVVVRSNLDTTKTASLTSSVAGQRLNLAFMHDSTICTASEYFNIATQVPACPDTAASTAMEGFSACVDSSGFWALPGSNQGI
jgi:hypothetical protein